MARVTLRMPAWAKELGAFDFDVDCWDTLARKQLAASEETWEILEVGHILAVEDRESFTQPWPGNRRFVWILDDEQLVLFDEHGAILHEEDESPDGCVRRGTFDREFAGNKGDYYRIPPESSVRDCPATYVDLAAAYGAWVDEALLDEKIGWLPPDSPVQPQRPRRNTRRQQQPAPSAAGDFCRTGCGSS